MEKRMSVKNKFIELKKEIRELFENGNLDRLELIEKSTDELVQSGYIYRKIQSFMYFHEFGSKEINEFFYDHCSDIRPVDLFEIPDNEFQIPVFDFIVNLKYNSVCYFLWIEMINFIAAIKEESFNWN